MHTNDHSSTGLTIHPMFIDDHMPVTCHVATVISNKKATTSINNRVLSYIPLESLR